MAGRLIIDKKVDDNLRWDVDRPTYVVEFWTEAANAWSVSPFRIRGADDVLQVFDWAREHAEGRDYAIYTYIDRPDARGRVILYGVDPTRVFCLVPPIE